MSWPPLVNSGSVRTPSTTGFRAGRVDGRVKPGHDNGEISALPIPIAVTYHSRMTTPILTAALNAKPRRNPRAIRRAGGEGVGENDPHNYVAQPLKKKPGAPLGNRNAARAPAPDADWDARIDALVRQTYALARTVHAACDQGRRERERLAELLRG